MLWWSRRLARSTGLSPLLLRLLLREPRSGALSGETWSDIDVCRSGRNPSFTVDVAIPSRDGDLVVLGLRCQRTGHLSGDHLRRQLSLRGLPLTANRTALLRRTLLRRALLRSARHARTQTLRGALLIRLLLRETRRPGHKLLLLLLLLLLLSSRRKWA